MSQGLCVQSRQQRAFMCPASLPKADSGGQCKHRARRHPWCTCWGCAGSWGWRTSSLCSRISCRWRRAPMRCCPHCPACRLLSLPWTVAGTATPAQCRPLRPPWYARYLSPHLWQFQTAALSFRAADLPSNYCESMRGFISSRLALRVFEGK